MPSPGSLKCNDSRGTPRPISTSGHTRTQSTYRPSKSVTNESLLWPPSYRTRSHNRQLDTPILGRPRLSGILFDVFPYWNLPCGILRAHVSDRAEDRPLGPPGAIVSPQDPHNFIVVRVWIATVQRVFVVQV